MTASEGRDEPADQLSSSGREQHTCRTSMGMAKCTDELYFVHYDTIYQYNAYKYAFYNDVYFRRQMSLIHL